MAVSTKMIAPGCCDHPGVPTRVIATDWCDDSRQHHHGAIYGKLSDSFGRKPVILAGIAVFLLGSVIGSALCCSSSRRSPSCSRCSLKLWAARYSASSSPARFRMGSRIRSGPCARRCLRPCARSSIASSIWSASGTAGWRRRAPAKADSVAEAELAVGLVPRSRKLEVLPR